MLATSTGQSIRCPVSGISLQGRSSSGVTVFNTKNNEKVVSVAYIADTEDDEVSEDDTTTSG